VVSNNYINIIQDVDQAVAVLFDAGKWLEESGKNPSKYWQSKNMNRDFMLKQAEPHEFYVALVNNIPAAAMILQENQRNQDWKYIDKEKVVIALYVHWLCVAKAFKGQKLPKQMIEFAAKYAKSSNIKILRLDTSAKETKLMKIYEQLGFNLMGIEKEENRYTAFYQKEI
jgi:ribosomal protein S18 acetylase RimI-like enzyme